MLKPKPFQSRNVTYRWSLALLGALFLFAPTVASAQEPTRLDAKAWLPGSWAIAYEDGVLGRVTGKTTIPEPASTAGPASPTWNFKITLDHPRTGEQFTLEARSVTADGDKLRMSFAGASASDVRTPNVESIGGTALRVPGRSRLRVTLRGASAEVTTRPIDPGSLVLTLQFTPDHNTLVGEWSYPDRSGEGAIGRRVPPKPEPGEPPAWASSGPEVWHRDGPAITSVTAVDLNPYRSPGLKNDPRYEADDRKVARLLIQGSNLPKEITAQPTISFDDPQIRYKEERSAGFAPASYRPVAGQEGSAAEIEVILKQQVQSGPKRLTLNGAPGVWDFDIPGDPLEIRFVRPPVVGSRFYAAQELYQGEFFRLELVYAEEPYFDRREFSIVSPTGELTKVELVKQSADSTERPDEPVVLRSSDILLLAEGAAVPSTPATPVRAPEGSRLTALETDTFRALDQRPIAAVKVVERPDDPWGLALDRVRFCRGLYPDRYLVSHRIFIEGFTRSDIEIQPQEHAAMLLLQEELVAQLDAYIRDASRGNPVDVTQSPALVKQQLALWNRAQGQWAAGMVESARAGHRHPLLLFEVSSPDGTRQIPLRSALNDRGIRAQFGDESGFLAYAARVLSEAQGKALSEATRARDRAREPHMCDVNGLLKVVGLGVEPVAKAVKQKLVRERRRDEPTIPQWVANDVARGWIDDVKTKAEAVEALRQFSSLDTDFAILVVSAALTGGAAASQSGWVAARVGTQTTRAIGNISRWGNHALSVSDAFMTVQDFRKMLEARGNADFARGIAPVVGTERYETATLDVEAATFQFAVHAALGIGLRTGVPQKLGATAFESARNIYKNSISMNVRPSFAARQSVLSKVGARGLGSLTSRDQSVFGYMLARAEDKLAVRGVAALTPDEAQVLRLAGRDVAVPAPAPGIVPSSSPPAQNPAAEAIRIWRNRHPAFWAATVEEQAEREAAALVPRRAQEALAAGVPRDMVDAIIADTGSNNIQKALNLSKARFERLGYEVLEMPLSQTAERELTEINGLFVRGRARALTADDIRRLQELIESGALRQHTQRLYLDRESGVIDRMLTERDVAMLEDAVQKALADTTRIPPGPIR